MIRAILSHTSYKTIRCPNRASNNATAGRGVVGEPFAGANQPSFGQPSISCSRNRVSCHAAIGGDVVGYIRKVSLNKNWEGYLAAHALNFKLLLVSIYKSGSDGGLITPSLPLFLICPGS